MDQPISFDQGGQSYFYLADALGSIMKVTDSTGTVKQTYLYDSFGNIVQQTPPPGDPNYINQPLTYTGREWDATAGLYYYRARYYDPRIGRFVSEDPIMFAGGINFYTYVRNNPLRFADPTGLGPCEDQLNKCLDDVRNDLMRCLANAANFALGCITGCAIVCLFTPIPPLCLQLCMDVCGATLVAQSAICFSAAWGQAAACGWRYFNCRRGRRC
jgi:RHS repeat-associated protein